MSLNIYDMERINVVCVIKTEVCDKNKVVTLIHMRCLDTILH